MILPRKLHMRNYSDIRLNRRPRRPESGGILKGIKILHISSGHQITDHRIFDKLARSIKRMGGEVTIAALSSEKTPKEVKTIVLPRAGSRVVRFLWQPFRSVWLARKTQTDIVHFHDAELLLALPLAKMIWKKSKFIYDVHEDFTNLILVRDWVPKVFRKALKWIIEKIEKKLVRGTDAVVGVTEPLAEKFALSRHISAYNFVSRDFFLKAAEFSVPAKEREFDLVHLGTLSRRRALFLVDVLAKYHSIHKDAKSLVIGASPGITKMLSRIVPSSCHVMEKVSHSRVPELLGNSRIGLDVHPWREPHLDVALPVKVCEYMACGCAVVSSSMPVLDRLIGSPGPDGISLIQGDDPDEYALSADGKRRKIERGKDPGRSLRGFALENMIWEKEATKVAELYIELLHKN